MEKKISSVLSVDTRVGHYYIIIMGTVPSKQNELETCKEECTEQKLRAIRAMDSNIRSRVRLGVQFNMKMIIRGSGRTGKTTLWNRLQGKSFVAEV